MQCGVYGMHPSVRRREVGAAEVRSMPSGGPLYHPVPPAHNRR